MQLINDLRYFDRLKLEALIIWFNEMLSWKIVKWHFANIFLGIFLGIFLI